VGLAIGRQTKTKTFASPEHYALDNDAAPADVQIATFFSAMDRWIAHFGTKSR
jgi:hypothetical protein